MTIIRVGKVVLSFNTYCYVFVIFLLHTNASQGPYSQNVFSSQLMNETNKLECWSLVGISIRPSVIFATMVRAYHRGLIAKTAAWVSLDLTLKRYTRLEKSARDKRSILLVALITSFQVLPSRVGSWFCTKIYHCAGKVVY